jgi:hypothetical protein
MCPMLYPQYMQGSAVCTLLRSQYSQHPRNPMPQSSVYSRPWDRQRTLSIDVWKLHGSIKYGDEVAISRPILMQPTKDEYE